MPPQTGPTGIASGLVAFDTANEKMYFGCYPNGDDDTTEGLCSVPTSTSTTNAPVTAQVWSNKKYTLTSIQYSAPLKAVVAVGQTYAGDPNGLQSTKLFVIDPSKPHVTNWEVLLDLGMSIDVLHQANISGDGKYLMLILPTGTQPDYPTNTFITVDLVARKIVSKVDVENPAKITILEAVPC